MLEKLALQTTFRLRSLSSDFGGTLTYNGGSYPCCLGAMEDSQRLGPGGFSADKDMPASLFKDDLPSDINFRTGQTVVLTTTEGATRTLKIVNLTDGLYFFNLLLADPAQSL